MNPLTERVLLALSQKQVMERELTVLLKGKKVTKFGGPICSVINVRKGVL